LNLLDIISEREKNTYRKSDASVLGISTE
jgi:hypothetical protein